MFFMLLASEKLLSALTVYPPLLKQQIQDYTEILCILTAFCLYRNFFHYTITVSLTVSQGLMFCLLSEFRNLHSWSHDRKKEKKNMLHCSVWCIMFGCWPWPCAAEQALVATEKHIIDSSDCYWQTEQIINSIILWVQVKQSH